ncbi:hypothetical protein [Streptococcus equinus]|uniref:hypothetical protein n=1 Tax=Streptococcus equinus TaxID=1335 RepID=UPI003BF82CB3
MKEKVKVMEEKVLYHKKGQHWEFTITRNSVKEIIKGLLGLLALVAIIFYFVMK